MVQKNASKRVLIHYISCLVIYSSLFFQLNLLLENKNATEKQASFSTGYKHNVLFFMKMIYYISLIS